MNENAIIQTIETALSELINEQLDHLKRGRVERTFTTDFTNKLKPLFETKTIIVDPFYNKHRKAAKILDGNVIELDIAIHSRGNDDYNLVAIELETNNNPKRDDIWKIEDLTQGLDGYGYKLGLFLVVGVEKKAGEIIEMKWYKNGKSL